MAGRGNSRTISDSCSALAGAFRRHQGGFVLRFALGMGLLVLAFSRLEPVLASFYVYPASRAAAAGLDLLGVDVALDASSLDRGYCALATAGQVYHVELQCTGVFYLFVFLGAVAVYPTTLRHKAWGVPAGVPAFFTYSVLRIVVLVAVGHLAPGWLEIAHIYLMVLLNLGFLVFALAVWANRRPVQP